MIETRAIVISREGKEALVEATQSGGCGNCESENGCGSRNLSKLLSNKPRRFRVKNDANAQVGAIVQIALHEGQLLRSALVIYVLPLIFLLGGTMLGVHWSDDISGIDARSVIGGGAGLMLGFALAKLASTKQRFLAVSLPVILPVSAS